MYAQALQFQECKGLRLSNLTHTNSPRNHISIDSCEHAPILDLHIIAPDVSPNTDGIDISNSSNIIIENSTIRTGHYNSITSTLDLLYLILIVLSL